MTQPVAPTLAATSAAAQVTALPQQLAFVFGHLLSSFHHSPLRTASISSRKRFQIKSYLSENSISLILIVPPLQHFAQSCEKH